MVYFLLITVSRITMWAGYKWEKKVKTHKLLKILYLQRNQSMAPWVASDAADKVHVIGKQTHNNVHWYW